MPTKTVSLTDEVYDILREIPKGEHSAFVNEAIRAVTYNDGARALHHARIRLRDIEEGLQTTFVHVIRLKKGSPPARRFKQDKFFDFMENVYLTSDRKYRLDEWLGLR